MVALGVRAFAWHGVRLVVRIPAATDQLVTAKVSRVLGDDHYKLIPPVKAGVARLRTITAQ